MKSDFIFIVVGRNRLDFKAWIHDTKISSKVNVQRINSTTFIIGDIKYKFVSVKNITELRGQRVDGIVVIDVSYEPGTLTDFLHNTSPCFGG